MTFSDNTVGNKKCRLCSDVITDCLYCSNSSFCIQCKTLFLSTLQASCINDCSFDPKCIILFLIFFKTFLSDYYNILLFIDPSAYADSSTNKCIICSMQNCL